MKKHTVIVKNTIGMADSTRLSAYPSILCETFPAWQRVQRRDVGGIQAAWPRSTGSAATEKVPDYSALLIQRTRWMSLALSSKPVILGDTTFFDTYQ